MFALTYVRDIAFSCHNVADVEVAARASLLEQLARVGADARSALVLKIQAIDLSLKFTTLTVRSVPSRNCA